MATERARESDGNQVVLRVWQRTLTLRKTTIVVKTCDSELGWNNQALDLSSQMNTDDAVMIIVGTEEPKL